MTEKKRTMPLHRSSSFRNQNQIGFFLVAVALLLCLVLDLSVVVCVADDGAVVTVASLSVSDQVMETDYSEIVSQYTANTSTILLDGALKSLIELPSESIVVLLPDDRLAIKSEEETSFLPEGSTVAYYQDKP
ncbi:MAG TPA: hypothetical protein ENO12_01835, partial [Thermoplasmatales archaeon]|nr:hypothetical protein [Thermoplasmatales archaeon]